MAAASPSRPDSRVVAVVVSYNPGDMSDLLRGLTAQCGGVVVVDNGSSPAAVDRVRDECGSSGARLVSLAANIGIAAAQNRGMEIARNEGAEFVLLSDHDSIPAPDMVALLIQAIEEDADIAAVGPLAAEDREGGDELVYVDRGWAPKRATKAELRRERLEVPFLIASGCLIRVSALQDIGTMREDLFIDHVDLEWGVRARRHGWRLMAVPRAHLHHSLGDEVVTVRGRSQPIHLHAPVRNYYLVRNTVALITTDLLPWRWRVRYVLWLAKYTAFNSVAAGQGRVRRTMMRRGLWDGLRGRLGPIRP